jgi:hypothetical protein
MAIALESLLLCLLRLAIPASIGIPIIDSMRYNQPDVYPWCL